MLQTNAPTVACQGVISRVLFRQPDTGFTIFRLRVDDRSLPVAEVVVKGATLADVGDDVSVTGGWQEHPKYGRQIEASTILAVRPTTTEGMVRYLSSGVLPGIGAAMAERIVKRFGARTFEVLDDTPDQLVTIKGIGAKRAAKVIKAWQLQKATQAIMLFLADLGVSPAYALRIYKHYGEKAIDTIRANPYRLATDVRGIGFQRADAIALHLGVPRDSRQRLRAGLVYVLESTTAKRGDTGLTATELVAAASDILGVDTASVVAALDYVVDSHDYPLIAERAVDGTPCIYPERLYTAEASIASAIAALNRRPAPWITDTEHMRSLIAECAEVQGMHLAPEQEQAVVNALTRRVSILTGGPGTGKTSTLGVLLEAMRRRGLTVVLGAPTGKAAKRMQEASGHAAATIARLIGMGKPEPTPIECDVLVLDEVSMVGVTMLRDVLHQLAGHATLVLVGDIDQLPSIGAGRVLGDLIESGAVATTRLTHIFRQAARSAIIRNAHRIRQGQSIERAPPADAPKPDFFFIPETDPERIQQRIVRLVTRQIPERCGIASARIQVLSPMHRSTTGTEALNAALQQALNPEPDAALTVGQVRFGVGDRIVQTVNNYELGMMNGENGVIESVDAEDRSLSVRADDGEAKAYDRLHLDEIVLAYAMTIHKSQGSQFDAVVMPVSTQHYMMLARPILYTAVTRAVRMCVLVGDPRALAIAIDNAKPNQRRTRLGDLLRIPETVV